MENHGTSCWSKTTAPARSTGRFLGQNHFQVTQSACLADAMKQLQAESFELVLLDLTLPDGNGLELLERFSPQYPDRMVVLTGTVPLRPRCWQ